MVLYVKTTETISATQHIVRCRMSSVVGCRSWSRTGDRSRAFRSVISGEAGLRTFELPSLGAIFRFRSDNGYVSDITVNPSGGNESIIASLFFAAIFMHYPMPHNDDSQHIQYNGLARKVSFIRTTLPAPLVQFAWMR
jgi:hypothetical protein